MQSRMKFIDMWTINKMQANIMCSDSAMYHDLGESLKGSLYIYRLETLGQLSWNIHTHLMYIPLQ